MRFLFYFTISALLVVSAISHRHHTTKNIEEYGMGSEEDLSHHQEGKEGSEVDFDHHHHPAESSEESSEEEDSNRHHHHTTESDDKNPEVRGKYPIILFQSLDYIILQVKYSICITAKKQYIVSRPYSSFYISPIKKVSEDIAMIINVEASAGIVGTEADIAWEITAIVIDM
ncbi:hypothetical protein JTB14_034115 [Gonioctena quinquepunctata]|nr:hypothetical protein JTB14_034115 [Gonioctena quinquepunctata]